MDYIFITIFFGVLMSSFQTVGSVCTFPTSLIGTWVRVQDGVTFGITADTVTGFDYRAAAKDYNAFVCEQITGNKYLLVESKSSSYTSNIQFAYLCINIEILGTNSIVFTDLANVSSSLTTRVSFFTPPLVFVNGLVTTTADLTTVDVCLFEVPVIQSQVLYRNGIGNTIGGIGVTCPEPVFGNYNYTLDGTNCTGNSSFAMCGDRKSIVVDYNQCSDIVAYSNGGVLDCMGNVTRGSITWLWAYNRDDTVDKVTTFRTTCFAIEGSGEMVTMTSYPTDCQVGQNAAAIDSPGHKLDMVALKLCPYFVASDPGSNIAAIAGGTVGGLILIAIIVLITVLCYRSRKSKQVAPTPRDAASKEAAPKETASKEAASKAATSNGTVSKASSHQDAIPATAIANGTAATIITVNETNKSAKPVQSKNTETGPTQKNSPAKDGKSPTLDDKNDSKSTIDEKKDSKSTVDEKKDSKSTVDEKDSKSTVDDKKDNKSTVDEKDNKSTVDEKKDNKSTVDDKKDSKPSTDGNKQKEDAANNAKQGDAKPEERPGNATEQNQKTKEVPAEPPKTSTESTTQVTSQPTFKPVVTALPPISSIEPTTSGGASSITNVEKDTVKPEDTADNTDADEKKTKTKDKKKKKKKKKKK